MDVQTTSLAALRTIAESHAKPHFDGMPRASHVHVDHQTRRRPYERANRRARSPFAQLQQEPLSAGKHTLAAMADVPSRPYTRARP